MWSLIDSRSPNHFVSVTSGSPPEQTKDITDEMSFPEILSINLEKGIYNYTIAEATRRNVIKKWDNQVFVQIYLDRLRSLYLNLKNPDFMKRICNEEITHDEYKNLTHQDFQPEKWKQLIESNTQKEESMLNDNIKANTELYACKKCKSREIYFTETQTRSADEQSTITLLCLSCGKRWTHG